ncbi:MAG: RNA 2',3'-cyclic phosphodiesterase [Chloroflexota bacterium]
MRAFIAIELDDTLRDALSQTLRALQAAKPPLKLKWVAPQRQHLTLHFLGEIEPSRVNAIARAMEQAVSGVAPFGIALADIGCFPHIYKPNVLWVGVREPTGALKRLQQSLDAQVGRIGFAPRWSKDHLARAFTPHLTLARVPRDASAAAKKALGEWFVAQSPPVPTTMRVTQLHLMQSELLPSGALYTALRIVEFARLSI